nr:MAG TPA: Telomerase activating protein Est1 [Caudoviricetes sp.]
MRIFFLMIFFLIFLLGDFARYYFFSRYFTRL